MVEQSWWEDTSEGTPLLLAFIKVAWDAALNDDPQPRSRFISGVEYVARTLGAAQPLVWTENEVLLVLQADEPRSLVVAALSSAESIRERALVDLGMTVRIAVHAARADWTREREKLAPHEVARCEQLTRAVPAQGVAVTEDVYLTLPSSQRKRFALLGTWGRGGEVAYVFPANLVPTPEAGALPRLEDARYWKAFRNYVESPEVRRLRYVGFPLQKKHPPSLDVREVFVPPEVRRVPDRVSEPGWTDSAWRRETLVLPREPLVKIVRGHRALMVLGDPGSGKTTALRWLAVIASGGPLAWATWFGTSERLLPLLVSVGRLAQLRSRLGGDGSVQQVLAAYFEERGVGDAAELRHFLARTLIRGEGLVLLDGLDEVQSDARNEVLRWLEAFCILHPGNRFVVSARWVGYTGFALPEGVEVEFSDFQDAQIRQYVQAFESACRRWENEGTPDESGAQRDAAQLLDAIFANARLRDLARNPFLLSALALIHRAEGRLPRHRVQAYEIFAWTLCETWGQARRVVSTGAFTRNIRYEEEAVPVLGQLALRLHQQWPAGVAPEAFIIRTLTEAIQERKGEDGAEAERAARAFLERAGREVQILLERGAGQWGFIHLTFQEFFTAVGLLSAEEFDSVAFEHLFDPRWEEVIRLGVGYMALIQKRASAAQKFIRRVLTYDSRGAQQDAPPGRQVYLSALLASEAGDILPPSLQVEIARAVASWIRTVPETLAIPLLRELALTEFSERILDEVLSELSSLGPLDRGPAILALGVLRSDRSREALRKLARDPDSAVRAQVATGVVTGGDPMDWEVLRLLAEDPEEKVRGAALTGFLSSRDSTHRDEAFKLLLDSSRPAVLTSVIKTLSLLQTLSTQQSQPAESKAVETEVLGKAIRKGLAQQDRAAHTAALSLLAMERDRFPVEARTHERELDGEGNTAPALSSRRRVPTRADEGDLHERVLQGDPTGPIDTMTTFLEPIHRSLIRTMGLDSDSANDAAIDAILSYLSNPDSYNPKAMRLATYLSLIARRRAQDQQTSAANRERREQAFASIAELTMSAPGLALEDSVEASHAWERLIKQNALSKQDTLFLQLFLAGERSTEKLAEALELTATSQNEKRVLVKRHQDRLMKRLKRLAKADEDF
ncbi:HEAT repeat domain-containing protein [Corallococcus exercitus]|uniref:NACHT domain-containing protein n=1 Tax=Corallococcus exercitus TaxID=2316736 RepID=A0A7Y4JPA1_9BACT|nr:HEAT repeat domain-containing protein [Corallococcus exercitus]NOK08474.1 NACHT domain-containing protein [Corallococcus exercitus]